MKSNRWVNPFVFFAGVSFSLFCLQSVASVPDLSGQKGGVIVQLGCGDGALLRQTGTNELFFTVGLDTNTVHVAALRKALREEGFGGQVMVDEWNGCDLPFIDNFVNALVLSEPCDVSSDEVQRVLVPNGTVYRKKGAAWVSEVKPRSTDLDEWTHWNYSPANSPSSKDLQVGPIRRMQWYAGPFWSKYHFSSPAVHFILAGGGRIFYIVDESPSSTSGGGFPEKWTMMARDAFNGKELWRKPMASQWGLAAKEYTAFYEGAILNPAVDPRFQRRFVVDGDRFYGTFSLNGLLTAIDAATGEILRTYPGTESCDEVYVHAGRLYLRNGSTLVVLDPETGKKIWENSTYRPSAMSIKNNLMCLRTGDGIKALDATTFEEKWTSSTVPDNDFIMQSDLVVVGKKSSNWVVYNVKDGRQLWTYPIAKDTRGGSKSTHPDQILIGTNLVWTFKTDADIVGLDPLTGDQKVFSPATNVFYSGHHHRCFLDRATPRYFISAQEGVEMVSLTPGGTNAIHNWTRAACNVGPTPANGLLYVPPASCACSGLGMLHGLYSYASAGPDAGRVYTEQQRLVTGPAFGQVSGRSPGPDDWPQYRYNAQRKSFTSSAEPKAFQPKWKVDLGGNLSAPVIADGRLFVANKTDHTVIALDADTGAVLWEYAPGGEVDSPPAVLGDCLIFGSADGRIYCLRVTDGALVWRFQAAPRDCRNMQLDTVTSVWPVHGSVLVENGAVYASAGNTSRLDGGIWVWALDALTGAVLHTNRVTHLSPAIPAPTNEGDNDDEGTKNDILVSDGKTVFLREVGFDKQFKATDYPLKSGTMGISEDYGIAAEPHLYSSGNGMLDYSWNHRAVWTYNGVYAQYLAVDTQTVYGVKAYTQSGFYDRYEPGQGYVLFAQAIKRKSGETIDDPSGVEYETRPKALTSYNWWARVPLRIQAMVRAGDYLFVAGQPDIVKPDDPFAAFEGRAGGELWIINPADGSRLAGYTLSSPPVFDGLAAANHCLYFSAMDGSVVCFGGAAAGEQSVSDVPVLHPDDVFATPGQSVDIPVLANDIDPDFQPLVVKAVTQGSHGHVSFTEASVMYKPQSGWPGGIDTFTYTATDAQNHNATGQVTVYIKPGVNLVTDPLMQQAHLEVKKISKDEGRWCVGKRRAWQWDRDHDWSFAYCGAAQAQHPGMGQVIEDGKKSKGMQNIEFRTIHQGTGDTLQIRLYGINGPVGYNPADATYSGGTLLYDSGNVAATAFDWKTISGTADFGAVGYDSYLLTIWTDGIEPGTGEFIAVDNFYLGL